jgi:hypothetical protein
MKYQIYKALEYAGAWCVEPEIYIGGEDVPVTRFYGNDAQARAGEYATWKEHFEKEPLHV